MMSNPTTAAPTIQDLQAMVDLLGKTLAQYEAIDAVYQPLLKAFEAEHADLIADRDGVRQSVKERDLAVRIGVQDYYRANVEVPAILGVKITQDSVGLYDAPVLLAYAAEHRLTWLLQIDNKVVIDLARGLVSGKRSYALTRMADDLPINFTQQPSVDISNPTLIKLANGEEVAAK